MVSKILTHTIFTYGSLMFDEVWRCVVAGEYLSYPASLKGYKRYLVIGADYPALVKTGGNSIVRGRVYCGVSPADVIRLDRFEGFQYKRDTCIVKKNGEQGDQHCIRAQCYLWRAARARLSQHRHWDVEVFRRSRLQKFMADYRGFIRTNTDA